MRISRIKCNKSFLLIFLLIVLVVLSLVLLLLYCYELFGYLRGPVHFWDDSPYYYPDSVWSCDDPEIWLRVPKSDISTETSEAWLVCDGEIINVRILVDGRGSRVEIESVKNSGNMGKMIIGDKLSCTKDRMVIKVMKDTFYNGKYKRITFSKSANN